MHFLFLSVIGYLWALLQTLNPNSEPISECLQHYIAVMISAFFSTRHSIINVYSFIIEYFLMLKGYKKLLSDYMD